MLLKTRLDDILTKQRFLLANIKDVLSKYPDADRDLVEFYEKLVSLKFKSSGEEELGHDLALKLSVFDNSIKALNFTLYKTYPIRRQDIEYKPREGLNEDIEQKETHYYAHLRILNKKIAFAELMLSKLRLKSAPLSVNLDPTIRCNYRCKTCHHGQGMKEVDKTNYLPISSIEKLAGLVKRVEALHVFGSGEPTLGPSLLPICELIERYKVNASILTNGSTLGKIDAPLSIFNQISISYDGDNKRTFQAIRENSDFDKINSRVKAYKEQYPESNLYFNVTVNRINMEEVEGIIRIASELGVRGVILNKMNEYYPQQVGMELSKEDTDELNSTLERAKDLAKSLNINLVISLSTELLIDKNKRLSKEEILLNLENHVTPLMPAEVSPLSEAIDNCRTALLSISSLLGRISASSTDSLLNQDFQGSIEHLTSYLSELEAEIKTQSDKKVSLPHCHSPWLRMLINSDTLIRPCCVMAMNMGSIEQDSGVESVWNGESYHNLRNSLVTKTDMPSTCTNCQFIERRVYADEILEYAKSLGVEIEEADGLNFRTTT